MENVYISNKELSIKILNEYKEFFSLYSYFFPNNNAINNLFNKRMIIENIQINKNYSNNFPKLKNQSNNDFLKKNNDVNQKSLSNEINKENINKDDDLLINENNIKDILEQIGENSSNNNSENEKNNFINLKDNLKEDNETESVNDSNKSFQNYENDNNFPKTTFENNLPKLIPRKNNELNEKMKIDCEQIQNSLMPSEYELEERFNNYLSNYIKNHIIDTQKLNFINNFITKINNITNTGNENTFLGPNLIGSYFKYGIESAYYEKEINIDILFTCKNLYQIISNNNTIIKNFINGIFIGELNIIGEEFLYNLNKEKNILLYIMQLNNDIKISCYFIDIGEKKQSKLINNIILEKVKYIMNENKKILCFFLRKWRKKWDLNFIIPELLDQIIEDFYKNNITLTFQNIMYNLYNKSIEFPWKSDGIHIFYNELIKEWFTNENFKLIQNACLESELLLSQDKFDEIFQ